MRKIFISDTIGLDEKIVAVADENLMAAFFWPWFLSGLDDNGQILSNARYIKGKVAPLFDALTTDQITEYISLYEKNDLVQTRTDGLKTYVSVPRTSWDKYQTHIREAVERESHAATNSLAAADNEPISGEHVQSNRPMSLQGRSMSLQTVIDADFSVDGSVKSTRRKFSKSKMAPGYRVTLDTNNTSLNLQEVESSESSQIESFAVSQIESSVFSDFESGQVLEKKYVRSDILFSEKSNEVRFLRRIPYKLLNLHSLKFLNLHRFQVIYL